MARWKSIGFARFRSLILAIGRPSSARRARTSSRASMGVLGNFESRVLLSATLEASGNSGSVLASPLSSVENQSQPSAGAPEPQSAPLYALANTFTLSSRPSATKTIYLDFNGHLFSGTTWNAQNNNQDFTLAAYSFEGDATFTNSELERIQNIWARVAEDFSPFDVNVTTAPPPAADLVNAGSGDQRWGIRAVIGGTFSAYSSSGATAISGSFNQTQDNPAMVFEDNLGNGDEKYVAEATTLMVGRSMTLGFDGRTSPVEGFYAGHGSGATGWAPIMGNGYYSNLTQWSQGEFTAANNTQDDLSIITTQTGFGYRPDDAGNSINFAAHIVSSGSGVRVNVDQPGVIETRTDADFFRLDVASGLVNLTVNGGPVGSNLDILAEV